MVTWYHASPLDNLDVIGLDVNAAPLISRAKQHAIYFGSLKYIHEQYLQYAPRITYFLYEVDLTDLYIDDDLRGEQCRVFKSVDASRVKKFGEVSL